MTSHILWLVKVALAISQLTLSTLLMSYWFKQQTVAPISKDNRLYLVSLYIHMSWDSHIACDSFVEYLNTSNSRVRKVEQCG